MGLLKVSTVHTALKVGFLAVVLCIEHNIQFHLWVSLCTGGLLLCRPFWPPGGHVTMGLKGTGQNVHVLDNHVPDNHGLKCSILYHWCILWSSLFQIPYPSSLGSFHLLGFWPPFSWCTSAAASSLTSSSSTSSVSESSWPRLVLCSLCFNGHYITRQQFRRLKDLFSHQSSIGLWKHKLSPILPRWALYIFILLVNNFAVLKVFIIILSIIIQ